MPTLSVVIPIYNERENLGPLTDRLLPVLEKITLGSFEVLFVNDGSRDGSGELLSRLNQNDSRLKALHLSRNFGHQAALQAGLTEATGQGVVLMDADLQDPPEVLEKFVNSWQEGNDVVYAVRKKRKEGILLRAAFTVFYRTMRTLANIDIPLDAGDFCLMDRRVVDALLSLPERGRFLRGLRSWVGFKQTGIEYERESRNAGKTKYTLAKRVNFAFAGFAGFSALPLRLASWLGLISAGTGFCIGLWAIVAKLMNMSITKGWASTVSLILFTGGVQLIVLGIIGEYLSRMYDEVRKRPLYIVASRVGFPELNDRTPHSACESHTQQHHA